MPDTRRPPGPPSPAPATASGSCRSRHRPPQDPVTRAADRLGIPSPTPATASGSCRPRRRPPRDPVAYASDRPYWCRWRSRQVSIRVDGVADRRPRRLRVVPTPRSARRRSVPATTSTRTNPGAMGPSPLWPWGPPARSIRPGGPQGQLRDGGAVSPKRKERGQAEKARTRKPSAAGTHIGRGTPIASPVTRASTRGPGGSAPCRDLGGGPVRGNGQGDGRGGGAARPAGEQGASGNGGLGEPPVRGEGFSRPVTGARAGKRVLPTPA
jgi:hypothetical protein